MHIMPNRESISIYFILIQSGIMAHAHLSPLISIYIYVTQFQSEIMYNLAGDHLVTLV